METTTNEVVNQITEEDTFLNKKFILFKKINLKDKYNFYEYLSVMIDGGVSISESLESVLEKVDSPYFKEKINELIIYISSGDSFSKSMKKIPQIFEDGEIAVIEAGETSGNLVGSLARLSETLKNSYELKNKIKSSLTYPIIIFLFLFVAVIVVLIYVIPNIIPLFENSEVTLPLATRALVATSDFVTNNFPLVILFIATVFVVFIGFKNTKTGRKQIEQLILNLPLIRKVYKNYILSNIASTLGNLTGAGINFVKTIKLTGKVANNLVYEDLFNKISLNISTGMKLVDSMLEVDPEKQYFPSDFTQMLHVGEKTASIEKISEKIAKQYDKEVTYSLANLTKWIEPIAILIAGIFVLWFAFAIFGAILKVTEVVG